MALGTFDLVIDGEQLDGTAETKARLYLTAQGSGTIRDEAGNEFKFPASFATAGGKSISLPYTVTLFTDTATGEGNSATIGYEGYVSNGYGRVTFQFAAPEAGSTVNLVDLTDSVVTPISDLQVFRDEAEAARDEAVASVASLPTEAELEATYGRRFTRGLTAYAGLVPLADRSHTAHLLGTLSGGVATQGQYRIQHNLLAQTGSIRLLYTNFYTNGTVGEQDPPNAITVRAGVELSNGEILPVRFNGSRSATIQAGGQVLSDPFSVDHVGPTGTNPWVRTRTKVSVSAAGEKWPYTTFVCTDFRAGDAAEEDTSGSDKTTSGTITAVPGVNTLAYGPIVLGTTSDIKPVVSVIGDSIAAGSNDTQFASGGNRSVGYVTRALGGANIPLIKVAAESERAQNWVTRFNSYRRRSLIAGATHSFVQYGINDLSNGRTLAQIQADLLAIWTTRAADGAKVYQATITPSSTSTDSWATTANQTAFAAHTTRINLNNWLRAGAPVDATTKVAVAVGTSGALLAGQAGHPLTNYVEVADAVESARDSGKWKVDGTANKYTNDGLHPTTPSHQLIAAAFPVAYFTA